MISILPLFSNLSREARLEKLHFHIKWSMSAEIIVRELCNDEILPSQRQNTDRLWVSNRILSIFASWQLWLVYFLRQRRFCNTKEYTVAILLTYICTSMNNGCNPLHLTVTAITFYFSAVTCNTCWNPSLKVWNLTFSGFFAALNWSILDSVFLCLFVQSQAHFIAV